MARILIGDPYPEIRDLLVHIVSSMGHEAVVPEAAGTGGHPDIDVVVLEPGYTSMIALAHEVRSARPQARFVCVSIYPPSPGALALDPVAYLVKPFSIAALQEAIQAALVVLARGRADRTRPR